MYSSQEAAFAEPWGKGYQANFVRSAIFPIFQSNQNTGSL